VYALNVIGENGIGKYSTIKCVADFNDIDIYQIDLTDKKTQKELERL